MGKTRKDWGERCDEGGKAAVRVEPERWVDEKETGDDRRKGEKRRMKRGREMKEGKGSIVG